MTISQPHQGNEEYLMSKIAGFALVQKIQIRAGPISGVDKITGYPVSPPIVYQQEYLTHHRLFGAFGLRSTESGGRQSPALKKHIEKKVHRPISQPFQ
jgi:hypothetical protein